jgi:RNA polymerase sigma-70 factor, ECF subfamily
LRSNRKSQLQADSGGMNRAACLATAKDDSGSRPEGDGSREVEVAADALQSPDNPESPPNEDELIKRSLAADHGAFEVLVRRYSPRVFSIIGSFFRRRDFVEDIAQDVFARAYFSLSSFTLGRSFEAWVAKIAVNACYDQLRAQRRRMEYQMPRTAEREDDWLELQMLDVAQARHSSSERQREAAETCDRLLAKIEDEDRLVLVLMDRDGYSVKEISDLTGWGQSKVKVRAFRARRTLRAAMKRLVMSAERKQRSQR